MEVDSSEITNEQSRLEVIINDNNNYDLIENVKPNSILVVNSRIIHADSITVRGQDNSVKGNNNKVIGNDNIIKGNHNHSTGDRNFVEGDDCVIEGENNMYTGSRHLINGKPHRWIQENGEGFGPMFEACESWEDQIDHVDNMKGDRYFMSSVKRRKSPLSKLPEFHYDYGKDAVSSDAAFSSGDDDSGFEYPGYDGEESSIISRIIDITDMKDQEDVKIGICSENNNHTESPPLPPPCIGVSQPKPVYFNANLNRIP